MKQARRRKEILTELENEGIVDTIALSKKLEVSTMTIRRDLQALSREGIVTITHGGAVLNEGSLFEHPMTYKEERYIEEKKRIGAFCASFVNDGDSVFIDTGTTAYQVAESIKNKKNIVVTTQSLSVMQLLSEYKNIKLIAAPGIYRAMSKGFLGEITCEFVKDFKYDILFLAAEGINVEHGISVPDIVDATTKKALVSRAVKVVAVMDKSKFGSSYFMTVTALDQVDIVVTNEGADPNIVNAIRERGVEVFLT